jgi:hypothetical protein
MRRLAECSVSDQRPLIEDDSVEWKETSLVEFEAEYQFTKSVRLAVDVFNVLCAQGSEDRLLA